MRLGYDLTLEQAQKLVMTPELRQAIQLLQFTSQELNQYLENEMEINPLLEVKNNSKEHENIDEIESKNEEIDWEEFLGNYDDISYTISSPRDKNEKEVTYDNFVTHSSSLKEHLLLQLNLNICDKIDRLIGKIIIESIDENGYLVTPIDSLAEDLHVSLERV
ncbi:RNA polymerase sigma-54 factor, partial [Anaerosalibacter bizertensis]|nr:RNA polymerase sigma-54 factor [Anaerosalibacter bizertensis]